MVVGFDFCDRDGLYGISYTTSIRDGEPGTVKFYRVMVVSQHWLRWIAKTSSNFPTVYPYRWTLAENVTPGTDIQDRPMSIKRQDRFLNDAQVCLNVKSSFYSYRTSEKSSVICFSDICGNNEQWIHLLLWFRTWRLERQKENR